MGYRTYLGSISDDELGKIRGMSVKELNIYKNGSYDKEDPYVSVGSIPDKCIYELGSCYGTKEYYTPVFEKQETTDIFLEDHDLWLVGKEFLKLIITEYKERVQAYYFKMSEPFFGNKRYETSEFLKSSQRLFGESIEDDYKFDFSKITDKEQTQLYNIIYHIRNMHTEWSKLTPFNLEEEEKVTTSWKYEYAIFELIRIYKTFDWKNNFMIYYGY